LAIDQAINKYGIDAFDYEIIEECECGILTSLEDRDLKAALCKVIECTEMIESWKNTMKNTSVKFGLSNRAKQMKNLRNYNSL
jgi:hypothetical protein